MKNVKKIIALMLVVLMIGSMTGCKQGTKTNSKSNGGKEVKIAYWNSGMGTDWLDEYVNAFNESQSEWYVTYTASVSAEGLSAAFGQPDIDDTDLYIVPGLYKTEYLEPLEDILEETAVGDQKPIKDKFNKAYLDLVTNSDGHIYELSTSMGANAIVYNKALFKEARIEVTPRTSNELAVAADKLVQKGYYAWAHFKGRAYYHFIRDIWTVQYDGTDYYYNTFLKLKDDKGNSPSLDVLTKKDGRYEALKAFEKVLTPTNVLPGSNSYDHITVQTMFLTGGNIGMMVNGMWLATEMESVGSMDGFEMMKTPVISSIINKLETVKNDQLLRELVSAIDEVTDGTAEESEYKSGDDYVVDGKKVSAADWDYVRKARNTVYNNAVSGGVQIPNYAKAKEGAKEFLKFTCSDKGMKLSKEASALQLSTGETLTNENLQGFELSASKLLASAEQYASTQVIDAAHPIFALELTDSYANVSTFFHYFCAANEVDRKSADQVWDMMMDTFNTKFDRWVEAAK